MPLVAVPGLLGNILSIAILRSNNIDMKVIDQPWYHHQHFIRFNICSISKWLIICITCLCFHVTNDSSVKPALQHHAELLIVDFLFVTRILEFAEFVKLIVL